MLAHPLVLQAADDVRHQDIYSRQTRTTDVRQGPAYPRTEAFGAVELSKPRRLFGRHRARRA